MYIFDIVCVLIQNLSNFQYVMEKYVIKKMLNLNKIQIVFFFPSFFSFLAFSKENKINICLKSICIYVYIYDKGK